MKVWKKFFIVALCVLAFAATIFVGLLAHIHYEKEHKVSYWENQPQHVSPTILMVHGYHGMNGFVRLKDVQTGKFTTPELQHIFVNEYSAEDSLVVFRTFDRMRGYLNVNTGQIIIPAQYNRAWNFSEGIAGVLKDGEVSFINANGEPAFDKTFPIIYDDGYSEIAFQFHHGLCVMRTMDNKWGLINTQGEWVVEPVYTTISAPMFGYRIISDGAHYGLITMDGQLALPIQYDIIRVSSDDQGFFIAKDGYAKIVDKNLNTLVPFAYDGLYQLYYIHDYRSSEEYDDNGNIKPFTPQYWRYDVGMGSGVIDRHGNIIIPAIYHMVRMVDDELFEVEVSYDGDRILFDRTGRCVGKSNF